MFISDASSVYTWPCRRSGPHLLAEPLQSDIFGLYSPGPNKDTLMNTMCSHQSTLAPFFVGVCAEPPGATARSAASSTLSEWMFLAVYLSPFRLVDFYRVGLFAPNG